MPLVKEGAVVTDPWLHAGDDEPLPDDRPATVSLARWRRERDALIIRRAPLGLRLESDELADAVGDEATTFQLIVIRFPAFRDGRPYSTARLLRERYRYRGELRAVGDVLRDQLLFMQRCGFDAFELAEARPDEAWQRAMGEISVFYQATGDGRVPASHLRHVRKAAE